MRKKFIISLALLIFLLGNAPYAGAFFLENWVNKLIKPTSQNLENNFSLDSTLEQIQDVNENNVIDGGDVIRFVFTVNNPGDTEYSFTTLKTGIDKSSIHFIRNIKGTRSLSYNNNTITFPNVTILPGETKKISFDATINYVPDSDTSLSIDAELQSGDKKQLLKSAKRTINAKAYKGKFGEGMTKKTKK